MNLNPFGRKSRPPLPRASSSWPELFRGNWNDAGPPRSYEALARDAYLRNPIAQRAVRIVAEGAAGAPVVSIPAGHPAVALLAGGEPGPSLIETIAANLLLHGNAYVEIGLGSGGLPVALYSLRPERVTVEADGSGWPVGYLYRAGDSLSRFPAVTIGDRPGLLHIRSFHPLDDHYGLGCLGAAAAAVDTHNAASRWNKALLDNAARPSGALVYDTGDGSTLSAEQFDRLKAEMEAGFSGAANAGRPMLLEGGLSWQPLSLTPAEMDFARARDTASREIALAFGVPPMLRDAVRTAAPAVTTYLLFYAPQVLLADAPELIRANLPAAWASPAFDVLQLEDYDFVTAGDRAGHRRASAVVAERLGYARDRQHYFAGFVARAEDRAQWGSVADAAGDALGSVAETFVWAWPQVARDGFVAFETSGDEIMPAFHDVRFPLEVGLGATGGPAFSTQVSTSSSGFEQRNGNWADARLHYDAGPGVRSEADVVALLAFFRARRGQAHAFRFTDPFDHRSADDEGLGTGDGVTTGFALVRRYGDDTEAQVRRITRPVAASVVVAVDGVVRTSGWHVADPGIVEFAAAPAAGSIVTASFAFDVPVRFADDRIDVSLAGTLAGDIPSVPLIEVREA